MCAQHYAKDEKNIVNKIPSLMQYAVHQGPEK